MFFPIRYPAQKRKSKNSNEKTAVSPPFQLAWNGSAKTFKVIGFVGMMGVAGELLGHVLLGFFNCTFRISRGGGRFQLLMDVFPDGSNQQLSNPYGLERAKHGD